MKREFLHTVGRNAACPSCYSKQCEPFSGKKIAKNVSTIGPSCSTSRFTPKENEIRLSMTYLHLACLMLCSAQQSEQGISRSMVPPMWHIYTMSYCSAI